MLKAILGGKGRRLPETARPGDSFRKVFRENEDLLTAAVFSRLTYLPPAEAWRVLRAAAGDALPLAAGGVALSEATFWPSWSLTRATGACAVEPDAFLRFDLTEPDLRVDVIVECKRGGGHHLGQWLREWQAHVEARPDDGTERLTVLLAVGLWGRDPMGQVAALQAGAADLPVGFRVLPVSWGGLADALARERPGPAARYVVADMLDALALNGHRSRLTLSGLARGARHAGGFSQARAALARRRLEPASAPHAAPVPDRLAGWPGRALRHRPYAGSRPVLRRL